MTITSANSVLILGAGASAAFGLPLGGQLLEGVGTQIANEFRSIDEDDRNGYAPGGSFGFWRRPVISILERNRQLNVDRLKQLQTLLANQTSETIDDFIVENPSYANLTKLAVAAILYRCCHTQPTRDRDAMVVRDFAVRDITLELKSLRNWIHLFINVVRQGIRLDEVSVGKKVRVVTFNYDCILEAVLEAQFSNTESGYSNWRDYIDIIHVHGQFPYLAQAGTKVREFAADIIGWAEGIHVVHEGSVPDTVRAAREKAREVVSSAHEIYAAGFAFAGGNTALLGLNENPTWGGKRTVSYCNWNGDIGVRKSVEKIARWVNPKTKIDEGSGTQAEPLEIEAWIRAGFLGEMPA